MKAHTFAILAFHSPARSDNSQISRKHSVTLPVWRCKPTRKIHSQPDADASASKYSSDDHHLLSAITLTVIMANRPTCQRRVAVCEGFITSADITCLNCAALRGPHAINPVENVKTLWMSDITRSN